MKRRLSTVVSRRPAELLTLLEALRSCSAAMPDVQELEDALDSILSELTEKLKFEFATISLVDEYRDCIETARARNISPGWVMRAKHPLNVPDIQTHVVKTGETKVTVAWDALFDKDIYDRFEHSQLARVFAPILSTDQQVVGTIEAGCNKKRKNELLTESAIEEVKKLGRKKGDEIARKRPHILLQRIAEHAIKLIGADSATLHVYRRNALESSEEEGQELGELILAAGAGRATAKFVQVYKPRPGGRGSKAMRTRRLEKVDDPRQFKAAYPELHKMGVRAFAVLPLKFAPDTEGVLAIHFWQSGKRFTARQISLTEMFAREMEGFIRNYLLLRRVTEVGGRAWALSGLQSLMQSLTSPFNLPDVLKKIAKNALLTLNADNVAVYQYQADKKSFCMPPVVDGQFRHPALIERNLKPEEILFQFVEQGASQFIVDAHKHPFVAGHNSSGKPRFIDREEVKSGAVLVLRTGETGEVVGLIFVNFRRVHNFSGEEKRVMDALATSAALAIRNARLHQADLKGQLEALHAILKAIAEKGPDLKEVLERLLQQTLALTGAKYGACMLWNERNKVLEPIAHWPPRDGYPSTPLKLGQGIIGLAAESRKSILVEDLADKNKSIFVETQGEVFPAKMYKKVNPDTRCEIAVPLLDEGELLGVLNIEHSKPRALTQDNLVLLQTLAVPAIIALHTVELYKEQKLENWKEVTGSIAHSVGTILFGVKGDVKSLSDRLHELNKSIREDVGPLFEELNNEIGMADKVLWDFRTFANPAQLALKPVDLRQVVNDAFQAVHGDCLNDISLPEDPLPVSADPLRLGNALKEIRKNAHEAMLGVTDKPMLTVIAGVTSGKYAQVEITDKGPGLSDDVKQHLFDPYFTTKSGGSGLGLAIARKVISAHDGILEADNSPDGGARFVVRLPLVVL